jgi:hypothetical protein
MSNRLGPTAAWAALLHLTGCAIGPTLEAASYEDAAVTVQIPCEDPFRVWENAESRRLKVSSSIAGELGRSLKRQECDHPEIARLTKAERFHRVAREHLKRTGREACAISRTDLLAVNSYELRYRCPSTFPHGKKGLAQSRLSRE